ncbi:MAG: hemerythrin domain-containing protein [Ferruginibacter sp.]
MKRHEALAPLSREHHGTLLLAQLLKRNAPEYKGLPTNAKDKVEYALKQFEEIIKHHFQQEEIILEKAKDHHDDINKLSAEIIQEHKQLTALFLSLNATTDLEATMDKLANVLQDHIRKEERVLFPLIQEHCPEELLQQIYADLH